MKEIGGYFGLEPLIKNEYHSNLIALNTGRNALLYILKTRKIQKLFIPYYLCNSVSYMLRKHGLSFEMDGTTKDMLILYFQNPVIKKAGLNVST